MTAFLIIAGATILAIIAIAAVVRAYLADAETAREEGE